jgi:hypothetical protein
VYDFTEFYSRVLKLDDLGLMGFTSQFEMMGYNSMYLIVNFGTLCWLLFVTPTCWIVTKIAAQFNRTLFGEISEIWSRKMFFNDWVGLITNSYLFLGMCVALNFNYFYFDSFGNGLNSLLSATFATILALFPLFVGSFYRRFSGLDSRLAKDFLSRYGNAIEGLNFKRQGNTVLIY